MQERRVAQNYFQVRGTCIINAANFPLINRIYQSQIGEYLQRCSGHGHRRFGPVDERVLQRLPVHVGADEEDVCHTNIAGGNLVAT